MEVFSRLGETTNYVIQMEYTDDTWDEEVMCRMVDSIYFYDSVTLNMPVDRVFNLDEESMMECHLEVLDGYSLYIPSYWGERNAMKETIGYHDANTWYGEAGESLSVVDLGETGQAEAVAWARETLEWSSTEDTGVDGWIRGVCVDMQVEVCIQNRSDSGCYAVILRCPKDATEARWRVLDTMAGSIRFS